jgi:hypothetical protein
LGRAEGSIPAMGFVTLTYAKKHRTRICSSLTAY